MHKICYWIFDAQFIHIKVGDGVCYWHRVMFINLEIVFEEIKKNIFFVAVTFASFFRLYESLTYLCYLIDLGRLFPPPLNQSSIAPNYAIDNIDVLWKNLPFWGCCWRKLNLLVQFYSYKKKSHVYLKNSHKMITLGRMTNLLWFSTLTFMLYP